MTQLHDDPRCYGVLEDLNTQPRTRYLARLKNPSEKDGLTMGVAALDRPSRDNTSADPTLRAPLVLPGNDYASITEKVCSIVEAQNAAQGVVPGVRHRRVVHRGPRR